jgi:hypothetical protein
VAGSTEYKRLVVRGLLWDSQDTGRPFYDLLKGAARAKLELTNKGKVLVGSSEAGVSVSYSLPPIGGMSAEDIATTLSELLDYVDTLRAATPAPTDEELVQKLLASLRPARTRRSDFSCLAH